MKTTNAKHTAGPWRVDPDHPLCVEASDGNVCLVNLARASRHDAQLIAAAPELLAALEKAEKDLRDCQELLFEKGYKMAAGHLDLSILPARAAIHKAQS